MPERSIVRADVVGARGGEPAWDPTTTVRPARADDAATLTAIARRAKASWGYPAEWLERWRDALTITPATLDGRVARVAVREGAVVGFAVAAAADDGWELEHLWVEPSAQGAGIGRRLVADVLAEVARRGGRGLTIDADPHALPFYRRLGATVAGATPAPMPDAPTRTLPRLWLQARRA